MVGVLEAFDNELAFLAWSVTVEQFNALLTVFLFQCVANDVQVVGKVTPDDYLAVDLLQRRHQLAELVARYLYHSPVFQLCKA